MLIWRYFQEMSSQQNIQCIMMGLREEELGGSADIYAWIGALTAPCD